jgi:hypothetical protein
MKKSKERATRPVNLTLRPATIAGIRAVAAAQYATTSRYVDGVLEKHLAELKARGKEVMA